MIRVWDYEPNKYYVDLVCRDKSKETSKLGKFLEKVFLMRHKFWFKFDAYFKNDVNYDDYVNEANRIDEGLDYNINKNFEKMGEKIRWNKKPDDDYDWFKEACSDSFNSNRSSQNHDSYNRNFKQTDEISQSKQMIMDFCSSDESFKDLGETFSGSGFTKESLKQFKRQFAMRYHPDKEHDENKKVEAEKKFKGIFSATEILEKSL